MDNNTSTQLRLIGEICAALDGAKIDWWLYGGWAMDAHTGSVTRDHSDIELFIWKRDIDGVRAALTGKGFVAPPWGLFPEEVQPFLKSGQEIGAWFLERRADGAVFTPGRFADWPWATGSFDGPRARLGELVVPAMSLEGLLDMKENFPKHRHGKPLRDKDRADIDLLLRLLGRSGARTMDR